MFIQNARHNPADTHIERLQRNMLQPAPVSFCSCKVVPHGHSTHCKLTVQRQSCAVTIYRIAVGVLGVQARPDHGDSCRFSVCGTSNIRGEARSLLCPVRAAPCVPRMGRLGPFRVSPPPRRLDGLTLSLHRSSTSNEASVGCCAGETLRA